jgi:hypothetical protein
MGSVYSRLGMALTCDSCGTADFAVEGRTFDLALICPDCVLVMCSSCTGRGHPREIRIQSCSNCQSTNLCDAANWADRLGWRSKRPDPPEPE